MASSLIRSCLKAYVGENDFLGVEYDPLATRGISTFLVLYASDRRFHAIVIQGVDRFGDVACDVGELLTDPLGLSGSSSSRHRRTPELVL